VVGCGVVGCGVWGVECGECGAWGMGCGCRCRCASVCLCVCVGYVCVGVCRGFSPRLLLRCCVATPTLSPTLGRGRRCVLGLLRVWGCAVLCCVGCRCDAWRPPLLRKCGVSCGLHPAVPSPPHPHHTPRSPTLQKFNPNLGVWTKIETVGNCPGIRYNHAAAGACPFLPCRTNHVRMRFVYRSCLVFFGSKFRFCV
jgi:hypothetical protein